MLSDSLATLSAPQAHYLKNVLRLKAGEAIRVFNPAQGECLAVFDGKGAAVTERLRPPFAEGRRVHLYAPPLAKDRMDFMIEKGVELGMTDFHPLLTERTQIRKVNDDRLRAQMIEAAEQCERMDIPALHKSVSVGAALEQAQGTVLAAIERLDEVANASCDGDVSILIGPPGGWSGKEREWLLAKAQPLSLGDAVLRAETAALVALAKFI